MFFLFSTLFFPSHFHLSRLRLTLRLNSKTKISSTFLHIYYIKYYSVLIKRWIIQYFHFFANLAWKLFGLGSLSYVIFLIVCICMYGHLHTWARVLTKARGMISYCRSPWLLLATIHECWELSLWPLQEQYWLLRTDLCLPSQTPTESFFCNEKNKIK